MSPRTLTIVVDAEGETCGECSHRSSEVWCDIYGPLQDLGEPQGDTLAGRTTGCLEAESLSRKALAVVEAARTASLNDTDEAHRALCVALSDYDSTKGGVMKLRLRELIAMLESADQAKVVADGFGRGGSWRGIYSEIAFEPASNVTVASMLAHANDALGSTLHGYKGGEYDCDGDTLTNIASYGQSSWGDGGENPDSITPRRIAIMLGLATDGACVECAANAHDVELLTAREKELQSTIRVLERKVAVLEAGFAVVDAAKAGGA